MWTHGGNMKDHMIETVIIVLLSLVMSTVVVLLIDSTSQDTDPKCYQTQHYASSYSVIGETEWTKVIPIDCPEELRIYD